MHHPLPFLGRDHLVYRGTNRRDNRGWNRVLMKSRWSTERRVEIRRERDWHRGPILDRASNGPFSFSDRFRNKGVSFSELQVQPVVARCPMTMQDPINMYKRQRHDTWSSVNADLYVRKVEETTSAHYRCIAGDWKANNDKYSAVRLQPEEKTRFSGPLRSSRGGASFAPRFSRFLTLGPAVDGRSPSVWRD